MDGGKITGEGQMRAPPFFADTDESDWIADDPISAFAWIIGMTFSAIHLIAWNFLFPSRIEKIIWRVASATTTVMAVNVLLSIIIYMIRAHYIRDSTFFSSFCDFIGMSVYFQFPLYFLMRLALMVEALISLRNLSSGAFAVVEWTLFIPHV